MGDEITNFQGGGRKDHSLGFFQMIFVGKGGIKILELEFNTS